MSARGWAAGLDQRRQHLSYVPFDDEDEEPPYAVADAYEPPHPLAVPDDLCDRLLTVARAARPGVRTNGEYRMLDLEPDDEREVIDRFREANAAWWNLDLDRFDVKAKHYRPGDRHTRHQDLHAGAARRKFAGSVQLSHGDDYEGGALVVHHTDERIPMPRTRGTLVSFPGWCVHEVEPVTSGERWALVANGWGPPLR